MKERILLSYYRYPLPCGKERTLLSIPITMVMVHYTCKTYNIYNILYIHVFILKKYITIKHKVFISYLYHVLLLYELARMPTPILILDQAARLLDEEDSDCYQYLQTMLAKSVYKLHEHFQH